MLFHLFKEFDAVHFRHHYARQDEVRKRELLEHAESLGTIASLLDTLQLLEQLRNMPSQVGVVLHDENSRKTMVRFHKLLHSGSDGCSGIIQALHSDSCRFRYKFPFNFCEGERQGEAGTFSDSARHTDINFGVAILGGTVASTGTGPSAGGVLVDGVGGLPNNLPGYGIYVGIDVTPGTLSTVDGAMTLTGSSVAASEILRLFLGQLSVKEFLKALNDGVEEGFELTIDGINFLLIPEDLLLPLYCASCNPSYAGCIEPGDGDDDDGECDRDTRHEQEELVKFTFPERQVLNRTIPWWRRWNVFVINAIYASNPQNPSIGSLRHSDSKVNRRGLKGWKGRYVYVLPPLYYLKFELDQHADPFKYHWVWDNPRSGQKTEISIGFTGEFEGGGSVSGSTKITIEQKDVICDEQVVYYCDSANNEGDDYFTGKIKFYAKEYEQE